MNYTGFEMGGTVELPCMGYVLRKFCSVGDSGFCQSQNQRISAFVDFLFGHFKVFLTHTF